MGGADKPGVIIGGASLLEHAISAARLARAHQIIVIGPNRNIQGPIFVREEPPFGGPVAAISTALPLVENEWTLLLAADLPRASDAVDLLLSTTQPHMITADGLTLIDSNGRAQWLAGIYRTASLRRAMDALTAAGSAQGASLRTLLASLDIAHVPDHAGMALDVDTWQDVDDARARERGASGTL